MTVWVITLEWNQPPSEVTDDSGIVSVHATEAGARAAQRFEQESYHEEQRELVYNYSTGSDLFCPACGERATIYAPAASLSPGAVGRAHDCRNANVGDAFCPDCGDELPCDRDHDDWTIDVHCTEVEVKP